MIIGNTQRLDKAHALCLHVSLTPAKSHVHRPSRHRPQDLSDYLKVDNIKDYEKYTNNHDQQYRYR